MRLFNAGAWWDSHEVLEGLWRETTGPRRELFQGLIQAAAAMVHHQRGNPHGVRKLAERARGRLEPWLPTTEGLDLATFLTDWEACLFAGGPPPRLAFE